MKPVSKKRTVRGTDRVFVQDMYVEFEGRRKLLMRQVIQISRKHQRLLAMHLLHAQQDMIEKCIKVKTKEVTRGKAKNDHAARRA